MAKRTVDAHRTILRSQQEALNQAVREAEDDGVLVTLSTNSHEDVRGRRSNRLRRLDITVISIEKEPEPPPSGDPDEEEWV